MNEKESLAKREHDLHEQEKVTRGELDAKVMRVVFKWVR